MSSLPSRTNSQVTIYCIDFWMCTHSLKEDIFGHEENLYLVGGTTLCLWLSDPLQCGLIVFQRCFWHFRIVTEQRYWEYSFEYKRHIIRCTKTSMFTSYHRQQQDAAFPQRYEINTVSVNKNSLFCAKKKSVNECGCLHFDLSVMRSQDASIFDSSAVLDFKHNPSELLYSYQGWTCFDFSWFSEALIYPTLHRAVCSASGQYVSTWGSRRSPSRLPSIPWRRATWETTHATWKMAMVDDRQTSRSSRKVALFECGESRQWILRALIQSCDVSEAFEVAFTLTTECLARIEQAQWILTARFWRRGETSRIKT